MESPWKRIPDNLPQSTGGGCILVRKPNRRGGWGIAIAYFTVSNTWAVDNGASSMSGYTEYMEIPE